jgi:A/G-specific adenine glycosylase
VWLSEIMLQQTTVAAAAPRFERFVKRWPMLKDLASASDAEVLSEWAGLGYYARARNLIACAKAVAELGGFPTSSAELRKLPGIGDYTSAAIAAIAFGEPAPAVDTNIARVISRLLALPERSRAELRQRMSAIVALGDPGDVVQAMMDLGATICLARQPLCAQCPLREGCRARASGRPEDFPKPRLKSPRPRRFGTALWIERDGAVWLVRRPPTGLLGGMAALPGGEWVAKDAAIEQPLARVRHTFTHFALDLAVVERSDTVGTGWWQKLDELPDAGLPTLYRKAVSAVLDSRTARPARAA